LIENIGTHCEIARRRVDDHWHVDRISVILNENRDDEEFKISEYPLVKWDREFHWNWSYSAKAVSGDARIPLKKKNSFLLLCVPIA